MRQRLLPAAVLAFAFAAGLFAGRPAAGENPSPLGGGDNPAVERFGRNLVFYAGFEDREYAEITPGSPVPVGDKWREFREGKDTVYLPGVYGRAIATGRYTLTYDAGRQFAPGQTGSVICWYRGVDLRHRGEYWWPVRLFTGDFMLMTGRIGDPRNREGLYAHIQRGPKGVGAHMGSMAGWKPDDWHLFVANWRRDALEFSLDGAPPVRNPLPEHLPETPAPGFRIVLNSPTDETIAMDELMVLDIALTPEEIARLWKDGASR